MCPSVAYVPGFSFFHSLNANSAAAGQLNLRQRKYATDMSPIDADCSCFVCKEYTRAYIHHVSRDHNGCQLITYHNIAYQMRLMKRLRDSILDNTLPDFVRYFMQAHYPNRQYPQWTVDALAAVNIELFDADGKPVPANAFDDYELPPLEADEQ